MPPRRRADFRATLTTAEGEALATSHSSDSPAPASASAPASAPAPASRAASERGSGRGKPKGKSREATPRRGGGGNDATLSDAGSNEANRTNGAASGDRSKSGSAGKKGPGKPKRSSGSSTPQPKTEASSGAAGKASSPTAVVVTSQSPPMDESAEACFICAEPMLVHAVYPCNHMTCGRCALRLRALYKQSACVYCKSEAKEVVFTQEPGREFASFTPNETGFHDDRLGLRFASQADKENALQLLLFHCPHLGCGHTLPEASAFVAGILPSVAVGTGTDGALPGWGGLKDHVGKAHHRSLCELCIQHKKIFTYEHPLYTHRQLAAHQASEHRKCEFCNQHLYGPDELYKHLRDRHFQCQMCAVHSAPDPPNRHLPAGDDAESRHQRRAAEAVADHAARTAAEAQTWYRDYNDLERHFDVAHYLCPDPSCRQQQYVVFENEMDYNSHRLREHAASMTPREKREALRVDAAFGESLRDIAGPSPRGRGAVPGAAPRPSRRNGFGGRLTDTAAPISGPPQDAESAAQQAFIGLATAVLGVGFTSSKLASMRTGLATYRAGEASAEDLTATVWSVVDSSPGEADTKIQNGASLIRGMGDLLVSTPSEGGASAADEKASALLRAWSALAATRNSFPTLGGGAAAAAASAAAGAGGASTPVPTGAGSRYASAAGSAAAIRRAVGATNRSAAAMNYFPALTSTSSPRPAQTQATWGSNPRPPVSAPALSSLSARHAHVPGSAAHAARHRAATPSVASALAAGAWAPTPSPAVAARTRAAAFPGLPQTSAQRKPAAGSGPTSVWAGAGAGAGAGTAANGSSSASSSSSNLPETGKKGKNKKGQTVIALGSVRR